MEKAFWHVVREFAGKTGIANCRRTASGGSVWGSALRLEVSWSKFNFCWPRSRADAAVVESHQYGLLR